MDKERLRKAVRLVAVLNLVYFGIEFAVARAIGSVSLFADSVDFLEDTSVNFLIFAALGWRARNRARLGMALAAILLIPGLATLWTAWAKFNVPLAPDPALLSLAGAGGLAVNLSCALMLARYRRHGGSLKVASIGPPSQEEVTGEKDEIGQMPFQSTRADLAASGFGADLSITIRVL